VPRYVGPFRSSAIAGGKYEVRSPRELNQRRLTNPIRGAVGLADSLPSGASQLSHTAKRRHCILRAPHTNVLSPRFLSWLPSLPVAAATALHLYRAVGTERINAFGQLSTKDLSPAEAQTNQSSGDVRPTNVDKSCSLLMPRDIYRLEVIDALTELLVQAVVS